MIALDYQVTLIAAHVKLKSVLIREQQLLLLHFLILIALVLKVHVYLNIQPVLINLQLVVQIQLLLWLYVKDLINKILIVLLELIVLQKLVVIQQPSVKIVQIIYQHVEKMLETLPVLFHRVHVIYIVWGQVILLIKQHIVIL